MEFYACVKTVSFVAVFIIGRCPRAGIVLRVFLSKQFHSSADTLIVNPIEYGDDLGMVLSHSNLQPIAFVEKCYLLPDVLLCLCCELAMDACLRFWRTFPLVPGDCLDLNSLSAMDGRDPTTLKN
jgi:hypothetical protein